MKKKDYPFCLIKFGKKKHLESLLKNGELFFNSTINLNSSKKIVNKEQLDENEGAIWIDNAQLSNIKVNHPTLGEFNFKPVPNETWKISQFNHNYLTCSFYIITTKDVENISTFYIDKKMLEFGDYALIIKNPKIFIENLSEAITREKLNCSAQKVEYLDLKKEGKIEMNPFIKKIEHIHQKEYRIILKNQIKPMTVLIKGMESNAVIISSKEIVETEWQVLRK